MTKTMRAAVVEELDRPLVMRELPIPEPASGQLLVRIRVSGVCHTDVDMVSTQWAAKKPRLPFVPGHEACGEVAAVGRDVTTFEIGDRVGVFWINSACGSCEFCATGRENICAQQQGTGYNVNGTYAEYCLVSAAYAIPLRSGDFEQLAPIMCAGVTSYKGLKALGVRPGGSVLVVGVGGTGHLAIQFARAMGLQVFAIDIEDEKVELAKTLGASFATNAATVSPVNRIVHQSGGGTHGVLVTAVGTKAFEQSVRMVRRGGTCVLIGVPPEAMPLTVVDMILREVTVRGSVIGNRQDVREALQFVAEGQVKPVVETLPLSEVNRAMDAIRGRKVKGRVVLTMD